jgi:hypothetical protein
VPQSQEVICGGRYLSGDEPMRVFAAGTLTNQLTIEVTWRSGRRSVVPQAKPNWIYEIDEAGAAEDVGASKRGSVRASERGAAPEADSEDHAPPFFQDVSDWLGHQHVEEPFDDFERQPLLPNRLSQLGPGVC